MNRLLSLYRGATTALGPLIALYLAHRMARGKEDRERFAERQGHASRVRGRRARWSGCMPPASARRCRCCR